MDARSIWSTVGSDAPRFAPLQQDLDVDVVIIGAGITGVSTALRLTDEGDLRVAVLEADVVGGGTTGGSTGNLYATVDQGLAKIRKKWGDAVLREVVGARLAAMTLIRDTVSRYGLKCELICSPLYLCLSDSGGASEAAMLTSELEAGIAAGLPMEELEDVPFPLGLKQVLRLSEQAQFDPRSYVRGLAAAIAGEACHIHEHSQMVDFDISQGMVRTEAATVRAKQIVFATHTPKGVSVLHTELGPYREYGIAARLSEPAVAPGAYWVMDQMRSIRGYQRGDDHYLIVIGEEHKTGHQQEQGHYYAALGDFAKQHFGISSPDYRWSAQSYRSVDSLPYIGRSPGYDNLFVATGYSTSGLVYGTLAGLIISDLILERSNRWEKTFDPRRFTPVKSAAKLAKENVEVGADLLKDYVAPAELDDVQQLPSGQGGIIKLSGEKYAVYRSPDDELTVLSPVCPHMKCLVRWNAFDTSWDCPCHGSRFHPDGRFIEGPAKVGLSPRQLLPGDAG